MLGFTCVDGHDCASQGADGLHCQYVVKVGVREHDLADLDAKAVHRGHDLFWVRPRVNDHPLASALASHQVAVGLQGAHNQCAQDHL